MNDTFETLHDARKFLESRYPKRIPELFYKDQFSYEVKVSTTGDSYSLLVEWTPDRELLERDLAWIIGESDTVKFFRYTGDLHPTPEDRVTYPWQLFSGGEWRESTLDEVKTYLHGHGLSDPSPIIARKIDSRRTI